MTDRVSPGADGSPACPFIAYEDERDERSSSPDHRHRCFAEVTPAPRALAHQEAYCLSSAFPVCPTFQDWARREAAQARGTSGGGATSPGRPAKSVIAAVPMQTSAFEDDGPAASGSDDLRDERASDAGGPAPEPDVDEEHLWSGSPGDPDPTIHRNPPRDWAAPPPWAPGSGGAGQGSGGRPRSGGDAAAELLAHRGPAAGLAGSAADQLAGGTPPSSGSSARVTDRPQRAPVDRSSPPSDELAGLVAPVGATPPPRTPLSRPPTGAHRTTAAAGRRPTVSSTRERSHDEDHDGPSWERARRYEAYPTIKTRAGLPDVPRVALLVGALAIAALALFFLPALLGLGGGGTSESPSPTTSASAPVTSATPQITPIPTVSGNTYTVKKGDTISKIAKKFGVTNDQLLAANKQIKDPNKIAVGDVINIPTGAAPSSVSDASPSPS